MLWLFSVCILFVLFELSLFLDCHHLWSLAYNPSPSGFSYYFPWPSLSFVCSFSFNSCKYQGLLKFCSWYSYPMYFGVESPQQAFVWVTFSLDLFSQALGFSFFSLPAAYWHLHRPFNFNLSEFSSQLQMILWCILFLSSDSKLRIMCLLPLSFTPQVSNSNSSLSTYIFLEYFTFSLSLLISSIFSLPKDVPRVPIF